MTVEGEGELATGLPPRRLGQRLRGIAVDIAPLRESEEFRRLWSGQTVSLFGTNVTNVVVPVQVYDITHSSLMVGLLGFTALVPLIVSGLLGATLVDAVDRRRLALCTSAGLSLASTVLLVQQQVHLRHVWILFAVVAFQNLLTGIDTPARRAFIPRLLRPDQIAPANALSQISFNAAQTVGPLVAGLLLATAGIGSAYLVDVLSFVGSAYSLLLLRPMPPTSDAAPAGIGSLFEGMRFLRGQPVVLMTFVADIIAMIFGMPRALFPALVAHKFHAGQGLVGVLYAAVAVGALLGAMVGGWFGRVRRQGLAVLLAIVVWALAIIGFGLTSAIWLALAFLALAGAADMVSAVFRTTILQVATPDALQGRMGGVFIVVVAGGPRLGDLESGAMAELGLEFSVVSGGVLCLVGIAVLAVTVPSFRRYRAAVPVAVPTA